MNVLNLHLMRCLKGVKKIMIKIFTIKDLDRIALASEMAVTKCKSPFMAAKRKAASEAECKEFTRIFNMRKRTVYAYDLIGKYVTLIYEVNVAIGSKKNHEFIKQIDTEYCQIESIRNDWFILYDGGMVKIDSVEGVVIHG